jgi:predicted kinase
MQQRRLILFCGLPGSGKTTISKCLCQAINAKLINLDDFKKGYTDFALVKTQIDTPEMRWRYYRRGLNEALNMFSDGVCNIVMDEVFHLSELRRRIEDFCFKNNISVIWIEVRCPYHIVEERLLSKPRFGHILSTQEALAMYKLFSEIFEPFQDESRYVVIDNTSLDDITNLVGFIIKKIGLE